MTALRKGLNPHYTEIKIELCQMSYRRRIMIQIPEDDLIREFGWFRDSMGENAVRLLLLRHPQIIESDLDVSDCLGLGVWFAGRQEADMLFRKDDVYYIVETKQKGKYYRGWQYVRATVESFENDMNKRNEKFQQVVAVLATSNKNVHSLVRDTLDWFEE